MPLRLSGKKKKTENSSSGHRPSTGARRRLYQPKEPLLLPPSTLYWRGVEIQPDAIAFVVAEVGIRKMDLDTENRLASLLLEEARRLQLEADREGVHAYLRKPNVRHRPNSRFLTATVRGVQQANRVVEVDEMWRAREKELELESKLKSRCKDRGHSRSGDSRGEKRKNDLRNQSSSSRIEECIAYNSSYPYREDGLGDDEIEKFLHSRVKRGRGAIGSRMDEPGPYLKASSHSQDNGPIPDTRLEEKWESRVQGPERPLFLRSKSNSPDDCWHRETLDGEPSNSQPCRKKEKKKENSEKKERKDKKKSKHCHHHHHKSRRMD